MGAFPGSPRTLRGTIIAVDPLGPLSRVVVFGYNPDQVQRTITPRSGGDSGQRSAAPHRAFGAPTESITMTVEIDATDQLETGDPVAATVGVLPQLSVLEMLLHPGSVRVIANSVLLATGTIEILPIELPMAVLVWGPSRVVPVRITQLGITEQAFDPALSPIRAAVEISAQVLTYDDLPLTDLGYGLSVAHLVAKELLAVTGAVTGAGNSWAGGTCPHMLRRRIVGGQDVELRGGRADVHRGRHHRRRRRHPQASVETFSCRSCIRHRRGFLTRARADETRRAPAGSRIDRARRPWARTSLIQHIPRGTDGQSTDPP